MPSLWAVAGIVLLLGPALLALDLQRDETGWCDHSKALHRRLNIIEKGDDGGITKILRQFSLVPTKLEKLMQFGMQSFAASLPDH
ncbi:uncharacterized protein [Narcine bancroftii]|uniref:uncharacterized protein isoform X3 n=1 Tax=Narcine bancroftii TaxID=1343680 RepID=UPI003831D339